MIQIDHERDVKEFENINVDMSFPGDKLIQEFAIKRLPLIKEHLDGVKKLEMYKK